MIYSLFVVAFIALICGSLSFVSGRSTGAPICRATQISDINMSNAADDPSTDYTFKTFFSGITSYIPNQPIVFTLDNTVSVNPQFKGILAFAEKSDQTQVGKFTNPDALLYTFTGNFPAACNNKETAITHNSATLKDLPLNLTWTAPAAGTGPVTVRVALYTNSNRLFKFFTVALTEGAETTTTTTTTTTTAPATTTTTTTTTAAGTTTTTTAAGTTTTTTAAGTTTTTAAGTTTTTAAGTTTTTVATTTTKAPGNSTTTTQKPTSAANQYGPVFMIIGTMMAMGLAVIGF